MKLYTILLRPIISLCTQQNNFVKMSPVGGGFKMMLEYGELRVAGSTQVYFISFIRERDIKMEQQFIVLKLRRGADIKNKAYDLLDDLNLCENSFNADISENSEWSDEDKADIMKRRERAQWARDQFYKHVKINIEKESLTTGISDRGFLTYE